MPAHKSHSRPRSAGILRTTKLGAFVREHRLREGLTQAQLGRALGLGNGLYISKVETARVGSPAPEFLAALARRTGETIDALRAMGRAEPLRPSGLLPADSHRPDVGPFKLGFGHCLWGAPIFLAAHRGMIPDFLVASYSVHDPDREPQPRPAWIQPDQVATQVPGPGGLQAEPWSAVKILDLLEKEEIHVGAIPGNVITGRGGDQRFIRIATIVDSATGCTFVSDARVVPSRPAVLSTDQLFDLVAAHARRRRGPVNIAAEVGTVADKYLQRAFERASIALQTASTPKSQRDLYRHLTPDAVRWHCESSQLARASFGELRESCLRTNGASLIGVLTWEPHASWLETRTKSGSGAGLKKFPLYFSPDARGRVMHMSFDLVILRSTALTDAFRIALTRLIQRVWQNSTMLSELDGTSFDTDALNRVAGYFGFVGDRSRTRGKETVLNHARAAIDGIRYSTHWAMESQALVHASPHT
jgi:transcriptional regulator with XRE-family HTH domain